MIEVYLTFPDKETADAALEGVAVEVLNPVPMPVTTDTGKVDAEGFPVLAPIPGWHVNCLAACEEDVVGLVKWQVKPATPFACLMK